VASAKVDATLVASSSTHAGIPALGKLAFGNLIICGFRSGAHVEVFVQ
jgi:hypothetical protein